MALERVVELEGQQSPCSGWSSRGVGQSPENPVADAVRELAAVADATRELAAVADAALVGAAGELAAVADAAKGGGLRVEEQGGDSAVTLSS